MPCGGIYPADGRGFIQLPETGIHCYVCGKPNARHFCDEWDCGIHARCVPDFLKSNEGKVVINHAHEVYLDFSLEELMQTTSLIDSTEAFTLSWGEMVEAYECIDSLLRGLSISETDPLLLLFKRLQNELKPRDVEEG